MEVGWEERLQPQRALREAAKDAKKNRVSLGFAQLEFSSGGSAFVVGLDHQRCVGQRGFLYFDFNFRGASRVGDGLRIERSGIGAGETKRQAGAANGCASLGDTQLHGQAAIGVDGLGIQPLHLELFDGRERFRFLAVENTIELAFADRVQHVPVLFAEQLLLLLVGLSLAGRGGVGNRLLADAASTDKNLGLQQQLALSSFALHMVNRVRVLDVGIKAKNHRIANSAN